MVVSLTPLQGSDAPSVMVTLSIADAGAAADAVAALADIIKAVADSGAGSEALIGAGLALVDGSGQR